MNTHSGGGMHLPPLNALRSFEAAGRLGSIRAAAAELVVTPGAVSRQVRVLESWLGVELFRHDGRTIQLTDTGVRYLRSVTEHLTGIAEATDRATGRGRAEGALRIRSYTLLASTWLIPRLTRFRRSQPWIEIELVTSSDPADFGGRDVDAEIRPGASGPWPGLEADLVVDTDLVLVCNPAYVAEYRLERPEDLRRLPGDGFLRSVASPHLWRIWFDVVGVDDVDVTRGPMFGDSTLAYQAAAAGHGVMLAPMPFVEPDLAAGRLVAPFPLAPRPATQFYLVYPGDHPNRKAFTAFRRWLLAESRTAAVADV
ncbi:LysR substrate-binding domain-containing protein [Pseudonocardia abyssalis]|uniref:LysR family transcriptional regulator n=1 Tax=Pseudonocardia abyssalis TaxID=2792008 RepID=A0ABS6UNB8_9PSEU|nr:LysR substrate-binding domain-containing protein [Pseudonocardia abyssalis]MBW0118769.1 LysR family transcriptional regulator [Pseudonocardia abyssalis]MBW0133747.1 LysR family transcriptional regulator [Pseudonocardia abyssalis]